MAKTVIWDRTNQNFIHSGGQVLVFAQSADADTWLARNALKQNDNKAVRPLTGVTSTVFDKITVQ